MSNQANLKIIVALATLHLFICFDPNRIIRYTETTLQYYAALRPATFDIWIYNTYTDPVVEGLVTSTYLTSIPRTLITPTSPSLPDRKPSFVILSLSTSQKSLLKLLINVDIHTPVFAFCWDDSPQAIGKMSKLLGAYGLTKAVLIPTHPFSRTIYLLHPIAKSVETIHALTPVEDLFPEDDLRDLGGHEVHFVIKENSRQVRLDGHGFIGTHAHWFRSTVRHLNGTFQIRRATCPKGQNPSECRWRLVQECIENSRIMVNPFYSDRTSPDLLISVLSSGVVVLAPNGRILSDLEVFLEPYDFEVWLTLLVVLGSCLIAQRLFFNTLESSLVLITVCGFERGEFHRTKGPMTICFAALTFYAFFMLESYSARIISLMTEKPLTDVPREIADFARFAIRLKTQSEVHAGSLAVTNRSGIYGQLDYDKTWKFQPCEMQYGIILSDVIAKLYVQREEFCDRKEFGHHILDESLGLMVDLYVFGRWNPLKLAFQRSQRRLFEAGFFALWAAQFERSYVHYWRTRVAIPGEGDEVTMLDLSDLGVPFLVLGMGGSLALIAFVFEFIAGLSFWKRLNFSKKNMETLPHYANTQN
ncbi:conserved hypothetical protein [Culex quinquefasciatus]|uniref:Ionotropic glutamate receptor C-terminal domain-containing protein n=1 Tax=Culex quinquefasciatus TaxID=7176 RepID=B0W3C1_CULQU|nr:conserved hypothetical protein [Culex quinquefasciatus]|eukprot:XP_001843205.1 conserved hypothetical protein [Culex quinquefasciatus]